jgi:predicted branched-subunit amino acid permease
VPHVGKRGRALLFFGALDAVYALSLARPDAATRRAPLFVWLVEIAPLWVWSAAWAVVGVVCLWQAFCRRDRIGFAAAIALKICWGGVCLGAWLFGDVDRGYVSAAVWLGLAYFVANIAGWPEPGDGRGPTWTRPSPPR